MGQSFSAYLRTAQTVRSVRQIHTITTAICEDPYASSHLKRTSAALTRKLEQVIDRPIASAAFLASIWRDFRGLNTLLEREYGRLNLHLPTGETEPMDDRLFFKEKGTAESRGP